MPANIYPLIPQKTALSALNIHNTDKLIDITHLPFSLGVKKYLLSNNHFESVAIAYIVMANPEKAPNLNPFLMISRLLMAGGY